MELHSVKILTTNLHRILLELDFDEEKLISLDSIQSSIIMISSFQDSKLINNHVFDKCSN